MSVSQPRAAGTKNPAVKHIKYKGGDDMGWFEYYDRDDKKNYKIDLVNFTILDEDLFAVVGFDDTTKTTFQSNEVRTNQDEIVVKGWKDKKFTIYLKGTYENIKDAVKADRNIKYAKSIYILLNDELCRVELSGATFSKWIQDVTSNADYAKHFISVSGHEDGKRGIVNYKFARFSIGKEIDKKTWDRMLEVDSKILQPYLEGYLKANGSSTSGGSAGGEHHEEENQFDTKDWRNYADNNDIILGAYNHAALVKLNQELIEDGQEGGELYANTAQALYDYQEVVKTWQDKKTQDGTFLKDLKFEDIKAMYEKVPQNHKGKQYLELAFEYKKPTVEEPQDFNDDQDIPF